MIDVTRVVVVVIFLAVVLGGCGSKEAAPPPPTAQTQPAPSPPVVAPVKVMVIGGPSGPPSPGTGPSQSANATQSNPAPNQAAPQPRADSPAGRTAGSPFRMLGYQITQDTTGYHHIVGSLLNESNVGYRLVVVRFNLYDNTGAQVDNASDSCRDMQPHATWKFSAYVTSEHSNATVKYVGTDIQTY